MAFGRTGGEGRNLCDSWSGIAREKLSRNLLDPFFTHEARRWAPDSTSPVARNIVSLHGV